MLSSISPPSSPYSEEEGPLHNRFSFELTVQCDGCLFWGLGWRAGLVAVLWVGQAYGVFHRPGFRLLVSVPRSLSTQPPFATQALINYFCNIFSVLQILSACHSVENSGYHHQFPLNLLWTFLSNTSKNPWIFLKKIIGLCCLHTIAMY